MVREKAQEFIQRILEEEVTELLGREKSERRAGIAEGQSGRPDSAGSPEARTRRAT